MPGFLCFWIGDKLSLFHGAASAGIDNGVDEKLFGDEIGELDFYLCGEVKRGYKGGNSRTGEG